MSTLALAERGKKAIEAKNYQEAITQYTAAIQQSPTSPNFFIQRSIAYTRSQKYTEALDDAEQAVLHAIKRASRELIIEAQFRRGQALNQLKRYADACFVLTLVLSKDKEHKQATMWKNMAQKSLDALPSDDPARTATVSEVPAPAVSKTTDATQTSASPSKPMSTPQQTAPEKIRHDWYQNSEHVYFTLLAKGVPKEKAQIDIAEKSVSIDFPLLSGASYQLTLEPLFAAVNPEKCIVRILPSKVEITLAKAVAGQKWQSLESSEPIGEGTTKDSSSEPDAVKRAVLADATPAAPAYPTSSKKGPKDWDKITDEDEEGSGDPNDFFKTIFKGASPDMQRAMMKSYTESNGTSLSTNWDEVSKGKVEMLPPDGMVAKNWSQ